jgi:hypothetical protein
MTTIKSFDEFFANLPNEEKKIVERLRRLLIDCADFHEKISYGVPYYFKKSRVCFIWPSSSKSGPKSGVALGFCKGSLLSNEQKVIKMEGRKEVGMIVFQNVREIKEEVLREIINEALILDLETNKK